jgi:hypothetical protein
MAVPTNAAMGGRAKRRARACTEIESVGTCIVVDIRIS